ncbi:PucR family transcriptional regulator [Paenibacillus sp. 598K]|uniref:PucR family transcriptional regulator n=1 Tax=Paenibacillus sp. 598K TaxID=1117987 RepID=UPI000FF97BC0|nr:PucR family transcriptional regulator [Paenibacillus sp. 598K]GBF77977.1 PucR family transcriptional regulator [Paenibacillus sp. 598K]
MQLHQLLSLPLYTNARVVAGTSGLHGRHVLSVNIMDAPDIIHYLKPHELLLTTAYAIKDHPEALLTLVGHMAEVGCAGIALKTKRFFEEVPEAVVRLADELAFPIIELSLDYSIGELANQSLSYILEKRTDELHYALTTHKQLSQLILKGESTPEIIDALATLIGATVLLLDTELKLVHNSPLSDRGKAGGPTQTDHADTTEDWLAALRATFPAPPDGFIELPLHAGAPSQADITARLLPIYTFQPEGYLVALADWDGRDQALTRHAMEQAANVIGLELVKKQAVQERSRRYKNEFFSDFVDGLITSEQELLHRSRYYNLLHHPVYICVVAKLDPRRGNAGISDPPLALNPLISDRDRHYQLLKQEFAELRLPFVLFTKNDTFCSLLAIPGTSGDDVPQEQTLLQQLRKLVQRLIDEHDTPVSIGIGNPVSKLTDIPLCYKEASKALAHGYEAGKQQFVQPYREKDLTNLLRLLPQEEMREYYTQTFKDLLQLEDKERIELMKTLHTFYETHCQLAETAKRLYVHRNTVIYRLDKCQRLTGRELRDAAESLRFRTAFAMEPLLSTESVG